MDATLNASASNSSFKEQRKSYDLTKINFSKHVQEAIETSQEVHSGWLKARTAFKRWTKVWCQVKPSYLVMYTSQEAQKKHRLGVVILSVCQLITRPTKKEGFCFKLINPFGVSIWAKTSTRALAFSHTNLTLRATDLSIGKVWFDALSQCHLSSNLDVGHLQALSMCNMQCNRSELSESDDGDKSIRLFESTTFNQSKNPNMNFVFRQFFDPKSSTYTYLIGDVINGLAVFIDTVQEQVQRELDTIREFGFVKVFLISTHVHADHITGNALLKENLGDRAQSVLPKYYEHARADIKVGEEDSFHLGTLKLSFLHTPGHTSGCICIVDHDNRRVFTGDTLLIRGCGRTDFQGGSSEQLYSSVHSKLFKLPRDYTVYPAHDYKGRTASSIGEEIDFNPRLSKTKEEFVDIMAKLNLAYPKMIDVAVPRNLNCGFGGFEGSISMDQSTAVSRNSVNAESTVGVWENNRLDEVTSYCSIS